MPLPDSTTRRARLRKLIFAVLPTTDVLLAFLADCFPDVHRRINAMWTPDAIVNHLFTIQRDKEDEILVHLYNTEPEAVAREAGALGLRLPDMSPPRAAASEPQLPRAPSSPAVSVPAGPTATLDAHALLIGIANYREYRPLNKTLNDVEDVAALLQSPALGGYAPGRVTLLRNDEATQQGILAALDRLAASAGPDSTVLIHFSGHGARLDSGEFRGDYLLPVDARHGSDLGANVRSVISSELFSRKLAAIRCRRQILLLDCCHAGGVGSLRAGSLIPDASGAQAELRGGISAAALTALASGEGSALLAACKDTETSVEQPFDRNGLFTKHLLDGLRGGAGGNGPYIGIFDLFKYVQTRVTRENAAQHPIFECKRLTEDFSIALRRGGRNDDIRAPAPASPAPTYSRAYLYTTLCGLLPAMFESVMFYLDLKTAQFAPSNTPQAIRASELVSYFELPSTGGYSQLVDAIRSVLPRF